MEQREEKAMDVSSSRCILIGVFGTLDTWVIHCSRGGGGVRNNDLVQCRLDRAIANQEWMNLFPSATSFYLHRVCSDHSPVLTSLDGHAIKKRCSFKYDHRCVKREGFVTTVNDSWRSHRSGQTSIMSRIADCRRAISSWKRQAKPDSALRIQELHYKIDEASRQEAFERAALENLKKELNEEYCHEEEFWLLQSRFNWLRSGDRNTKFFLAVTKNRRAQSRIKSLIDDEGREWFADRDLGRVAEQYFKTLFSTEYVGIDLPEWEEIPELLSPAQNELLLKEVTTDEVRKAVFEINPNKCPPTPALSASGSHPVSTVGA